MVTVTEFHCKQQFLTVYPKDNEINILYVDLPRKTLLPWKLVTFKLSTLTVLGRYCRGPDLHLLPAS